MQGLYVRKKKEAKNLREWNDAFPVTLFCNQDGTAFKINILDINIDNSRYS
jgi:hypothetical protein